MARVPLHYIDLRTFCYVTEDDERVERALRTLLPDEFEIERTESEGHHGDRILVLSTRIDNAADVRYVLDRLREASEFESIFDEIEDRVDDNCSFFLRLDKQAAYGGEVRLGDGITLRAKVEAYPAKREAAIENIREALTTADA